MSPEADHDHRFSPATKAWITLGIGVAAYDLLSQPGQTLSEGVDRALEHSPAARALTLAAIGAIALHLANKIPPKADPFRIGLELIRGSDGAA